jgi:hypothetical protein
MGGFQHPQRHVVLVWGAIAPGSGILIEQWYFNFGYQVDDIFGCQVNDITDNSIELYIPKRARYWRQQRRCQRMPELVGETT